MIPPGRYSQRSADQLLNYLVTDLRRAMNERRPLEEKWIKFNRLYRAQPEEETKQFPWAGAANLVVPMVATDTDIIFSRLMALLFTPRNLWTVVPTRPDAIDFARAAEEFLEWAQHNELAAYDPIADFVLETCKLGTGVLKTRYTREQRKVYEFREMQGQTFERQARVLLKDCPSVHHVSLFDFYVPSMAVDLQSAAWCAERIGLTWSQLVNRANAGIYTGLDKLGQHWAQSKGHIVQRELQSLDNFIPSRGDQFDLYEFWLDWDIDGDGEQEALVCTIHLETQTYLRLDFNPFFNQEKPYDVARYTRQPKRFYGIGIAEMLEHFQDEITTMHNQRIDSSTVHNAQLILAQKTGNIKQDEPIFPGRILLVDDPNNEVKVVPLGMNTENSTIPNEQISLQYANKRTGVNDYISGGDDPSVGYSTATTAVQQLREGAKRFDQTMREIRRAVAGVGQKVLELYQQFNQGAKPYLAMGPQDGQLVQEVLSFPLDIVRSAVLVDVTATSAAYNKEVEIRTDQIVMQQLQGFYQQTIQMLMMAMNPQLPPLLQQIALQSAQGAQILMKRILDNYGIQDSSQLLPELDNAQQRQQQQLNSILATIGGAAPMGAGPGAAPGMAAGGGGYPGAVGGSLAGAIGPVGNPGAFPGAGGYQGPR